MPALSHVLSDIYESYHPMCLRIQCQKRLGFKMRAATGLSLGESGSLLIYSDDWRGEVATEVNYSGRAGGRKLGGHARN